MDILMPGPNALRALKGLGVLDVVLEKINEMKPNQRLFRFVPIAGEHELLLDVRYLSFYIHCNIDQFKCITGSTMNLQLRDSTMGLEYTGVI